MKNLKAQYIFGTSVLLLLGAGCSFSLDTKPEEKVAPMVYTPQLIAENETDARKALKKWMNKSDNHFIYDEDKWEMRVKEISSFPVIVDYELSSDY